MNILNEKQINELKELGFEEYIPQLKNGYKRASTLKLNKLVWELTETPNKNYSCGQCAYNAFKQLIPVYEKSLEELNKPENNISQPTKRGRKRKEQ